MLTRFVRTQLVIFAVVSVVGVSMMMFTYMQVPTLLGVGRLTVTVELPASGGLYQFSNVTYRGVQVGKVTDVQVVDGTRVNATLSLNTTPKIPANLVAQVRSMSAVGEQYLDLQPHDDSPPYLHNGSVISLADTKIPQKVGPMLDQLNALVTTIPQDKLSVLLDESFKGFDGAGYDLGSLLDSSSKLTGDLNGAADQMRALVDDSGPLLDGQVQSADSLRTWARSLAGITDQLSENDPQVRTLLQNGPGALDEASRLFTDLKPTLPVLLANLTTIGRIGVTYNPSIEQILVLLPPYVAALQSVTPGNNPTGIAIGDVAMTIADPPSCTVGFLPPSSWRSPEDTSDVDTPDGLYCKLPQDSPLAVRGARNYPCMEHPGKRAPTVQLCDDPRGFVPLAQRQHTLGPSPFDPSLIAQGIPPDSRIDPSKGLYGPLEGTPLPPGVLPPTPDAPADAPPITAVPEPQPADAPAGGVGVPDIAPSSYSSNDPAAQPSIAVAKYDPTTGSYMAPDGHMYRQADLATDRLPKSWTELVLPQ
ncbi:virulence factor Mce [Mycolicibacterium setense]|uniref:MCE family protein n=1 Tax=Mycolicibacterium setense TaxID=431269 RepID=UPI0007EB861E|nr:MlaD family protein [Mycolicibacterium setense]OBB17652.1 virulence factor Mce [Mycolicibacterium setense]